MRVICIIPSRMSSARFPGKPLKKILGIPMLGHCYYRATLAFSKQNVFIATCDKDIYKYINSIGGQAIYTSKRHKRATTRTSEAAKIIKNNFKIKYDLIVMYQGDEPLVKPNDLKRVLNCFKDPNVNIVNLMSKIEDKKILVDKNNVKVVVKKNNDAIYFSRLPIPSRDNFRSKVKYYLQSGVIAFREKHLLEFNSISETYLEKTESVDMNRLIENNINVRMVLTKGITLGIDTKKELLFAEKILKKDKFINKYK